MAVGCMSPKDALEAIAPHSTFPRPDGYGYLCNGVKFYWFEREREREREVTTIFFPLLTQIFIGHTLTIRPSIHLDVHQ